MTAKRGFDVYQAIGGTSMCRKLSTAFYARVARDTLLRPLFPGKTLKCAIEEFAAFLVQFLGGPSEDAQRRWWLSLRESHLRFKIGPKEREAWMQNMAQALDEVEIEEPMRSALRGFFERASAYVVNRGSVLSVARDPSANSVHREIGRRWDVQHALDETVAAVRSGDADGAKALAQKLDVDSSVFAGLLAQMIRSGNSALLDYTSEKLRGDPALVRERYRSRTLLHEASGAGSLPVAKLLLTLGADTNATDAGGHTPLYCAGNECSGEEGGQVVHALVHAGANVDASDGVKHCTPLHMAARRGNSEVARALLDCGANVEARDSLGDTPLRRAVNCGQLEVVSLLLARGADVESKGSKGLTPRLAARTGAMKQLLQSSKRSNSRISL